MSRPVLLIAGGSGGIGGATAKLAGARGYDVAVNYKNNSNAAAGVCARSEGPTTNAGVANAAHAIAIRISRLIAGLRAVPLETRRVGIAEGNAGYDVQPP